MASFDLKGRAAVAALDPATRQRVARSQAMTRCANKPLLLVLEQLARVRCVGGLSGPLARVEYFLCLVVRLLQIGPPPAIVVAMLEQDVHKYMRVAAMFVARLLGNAALRRAALTTAWADYRKVRVYGNDVADDTRHSSGSNAAAAALAGGKRARNDGDTDARAAAAAQKTAAPHYFVLRLDELADQLFNVPLRAPGDAGGDVAPAVWDAHVFLGIPMPAIVW